MFSAAVIKDTFTGEGFDVCGITPVRSFADQRAFYDGWIGRGYGGSLDYLRRNVDKRFDPGLLMPGAKSIVVCGVSCKNDTSMGYSGSSPAGYPESQVPVRGSCGQASADYSGLPLKVASYARAADYHDTIKSMLKSAAAGLEERYGAFRRRAFTDSAPILEKRAAVEAGLGWIGRNTLLVSPRLGSFILLGELVIDRAVDVYDSPVSGARCGSCTKCVDACPNGALTPEGIDTRRCIACVTIEKELPVGARDVPGAVPTHGWIFGCDECQSVCPYNVLAPMYSDPRFRPVFDPREITAEDWLNMTPERFRHDLAATPLERAGLERLKNNLKIEPAQE